MNEQPPRLEGMEFTEEEKSIILKLREKGSTDAEALAAFQKWAQQKEAVIMQRAEEGESPDDQARSSIQLDLQKGKLLGMAGFFAEAWQAFRDAGWSANNLGAAGVDLHKEATSWLQDLYKEGYEPPEEE